MPTGRRVPKLGAQSTTRRSDAPSGQFFPVILGKLKPVPTAFCASLSSRRRYVTRIRRTPDDVSARLYLLTFVVGGLAGSYPNPLTMLARAAGSLGSVCSWTGRFQPQCGGGARNPDDAGLRRLLRLAASLLDSVRELRTRYSTRSARLAARYVRPCQIRNARSAKRLDRFNLQPAPTNGALHNVARLTSAIQQH